MSLDGHCCQRFQINASNIMKLFIYFFNSVRPLPSPNMYSSRLCTPELFNQGWTREGALEMLTWRKYEKTHFPPPPPSLFGKAMLTSGLFGSRICTDTNRHWSIWGKKGLEVITSLAVASLNITQEGRGSMKLLKDSLWEVWINSRFWLRNPFVKLRNGRRQFCHQHRSSPRGDHPRSLGFARWELSC